MIDQLKRMATFAAVVEQGSFGGAARSLGTTTSAVSQHIRALEKEVGVSVLAADDTLDTLREGRVVPVLPGWSLPPLPVHALTPQRGAQPAKVRLALDALRTHMAQWPASVYLPLAQRGAAA